MPTARDIMTSDVTCVGENETVLDAAKKMADLGVGSLPICGGDKNLHGMLTDRDIVVKGLAQGRDPASTRCGELAQGTVRWIGADSSLDDALGMMREHAVKRLIVMDDGKRLTGIITEADVATHAPEGKTGEMVEAIAAKPPQHF
jgi:CBS domain-containing protein